MEPKAEGGLKEEPSLRVLKELVTFRQEMHKHAEPAWEEHETVLTSLPRGDPQSASREDQEVQRRTPSL